LIKLSWPKFNNDFKQTIKRLKTLSRIVDTKAEEVRLRDDREKNTELLSAMELLKGTNIAENLLPCYLIPFGIDEQFYGRLDILEKVETKLLHEDGGLKVAVLWGMGGVGKTKIALQYVNKCRKDFDAIFWISADNSIKLTQDFLEVSKRLHLSPDVDDAQDAVAAMSKVKTWLSTTRE
jgi:NB-ARC domain